jgi:HSP20 family protein
MNLVNYQPSKMLSNVFDEFFNRSLSDIVGSDFTFTQPSVNIVENDDFFDVEVAAPGLKKEDFNVEVNKNNLTISARKEEEKEETTEGKVTRSEFNYSSFTRSFYLPETVDADKITATYHEGILRLQLPKKEEAKVKAPKTINIK